MEIPDPQDTEALLRSVVRALAFGDLVPVGTEDRGSLVHHPEEQGTLFSLLEHPRQRHSRVAQLSEGGPESETEKVGGVQQGG